MSTRNSQGSKLSPCIWLYNQETVGPYPSKEATTFLKICILFCKSFFFLFPDFVLLMLPFSYMINNKQVIRQDFLNVQRILQFFRLGKNIEEIRMQKIRSNNNFGKVKEKILEQMPCLQHKISISGLKRHKLVDSKLG